MVNMNHFEDPAIYALHAGDYLYAYVGTTKINTKNRLWEHRYRARSGHNSPVYQWMREVGIDNVQIEVIAREADVTLRDALEVAAIAQLKDAGYPLVNVSWARGSGLPVASKEFRRIANGSALAGPAREPKTAPPKRVKVIPVRAPRKPQHGTRNEAEKYKCKCDPCRLVVAQRNAVKRGRPIPLVAPPRAD